MAKDKAGNKSTYSFAIDKLATTVTAIITNKASVANNGFANTNVTVAVSDSALSSKSIELNNKTISWTSSNTFSSEGKWHICNYRDR